MRRLVLARRFIDATIERLRETQPSEPRLQGLHLGVFGYQLAADVQIPVVSLLSGAQREPILKLSNLEGGNVSRRDNNVPRWLDTNVLKNNLPADGSKESVGVALTHALSVCQRWSAARPDAEPTVVLLCSGGEGADELYDRAFRSLQLLAKPPIVIHLVLGEPSSGSCLGNRPLAEGEACQRLWWRSALLSPLEGTVERRAFACNANPWVLVQEVLLAGESPRTALSMGDPKPFVPVKCGYACGTPKGGIRKPSGRTIAGLVEETGVVVVTDHAGEGIFCRQWVQSCWWTPTPRNAPTWMTLSSGATGCSVLGAPGGRRSITTTADSPSR